jgi:hypothetical protein
MQLVEIVAAVAVLQFLTFGALTGRARKKSGLKAPAMTGDAGFERMYRVQMNTMEVIVAFLPALFLAANYWPEYLVAGMGAVYVIGRHLYWRAYVSAPETRGLGFGLSILPVIGLALMALAGAVLSAFGLIF